MISSIKNIAFGFDSHALPPHCPVFLNTYAIQKVKNPTNKLLTRNDIYGKGFRTRESNPRQSLASLGLRVVKEQKGNNTRPGRVVKGA